MRLRDLSGVGDGARSYPLLDNVHKTKHTKKKNSAFSSCTRLHTVGVKSASLSDGQVGTRHSGPTCTPAHHSVEYPMEVTLPQGCIHSLDISDNLLSLALGMNRMEGRGAFLVRQETMSGTRSWAATRHLLVIYVPKAARAFSSSGKPQLSNR